MTRTCKACNITQSLENFSAHKSCKEGKRWQCKSCESSRMSKYRQTPEGRANRNTAKKRYLQTEKGKLNKRKEVRKYQLTENGKATSRATSAKRRAKKLKATPSWADLEAIKEFYKNCPEGYHVDHIIPLQGKEICGLHVLNNLQYLPAKENISKGNRWGIRS